jgi:hypothetical protein
MTRPRYAAALALVGVLTTAGGGSAWACRTPTRPSGCVYQGHHQLVCPSASTTSSTTSTTVPPTTPPPTKPPTTTPPPTTAPPSTTLPPPTTVPPPTTIPPTTTVPRTTRPPVTTVPPTTTVPRHTTATPGDCIYQGHHQQVCPTAAVADSPPTAGDTQLVVPAALDAPATPTADAVADDSGQLAFTGSNIGMWVCLAGVFLILGVALVVLPAKIASRRR